jgi:hypothetical protein
VKKLVVSIAVMGALAGLGAAPAQATFPGQNGKIAFTRGGDIWTMNPDGSNQVNLTNDGTSQGSPAWSADGSEIAFTQSPGSGTGIWKMHADGAGRIKLSDGTTGDFDPSWSPDDQKILFTSCCPPGHDFTVETMNADGTGRTVLSDNLAELFRTDWASDGSKAWVEADKCNGYVSVFMTTFGLLTGSTCGNGPNSDTPSWSPDSQRLAYSLEHCDFCGNYSVNTVKRDGTDPQQLTASPPGTGDGSPAWSPDGSKIAFVHSDGRIKVMNADGSGITDITDGSDPNWQAIPINSYPRPRGATPMRLPLVPANTQCTAPNTTHGAPLSFGSCGPPQLTSSQLTTGTPDSNGLPVRMSAFMQLRAAPGDVRIDADINDVFKKNLTDYTGQLRAALPVRITDKNNTPAPGGPGAATSVPFQYGFDIPCTPDPATNIGSDCSISTTADTLVPGTIAAGLRTIWQIGRVRVDDAGPDGNPDTTADNTVFAVQGIFVP